jgi:DNA-binding NtrC family response regulator
MAQHVSGLLVYDQSLPLELLRTALNDRSLCAGRARTCEEARHLIEATEPQLIFTDVNLPDGTWADVVRLGQDAASPANVIVVSGNLDMKFYIRTMESGAFDFMSPPFDAHSLDYVVRCAVSNVMTRRNERLLTLAAV